MDVFNCRIRELVNQWIFTCVNNALKVMAFWQYIQRGFNEFVSPVLCVLLPGVRYSDTAIGNKMVKSGTSITVFFVNVVIG